MHEFTNMNEGYMNWDVYILVKLIAINCIQNKILFA